jgi:hypothetical protein
MRPERVTIRSALLFLAFCAGCGEPSRFGTLPDAGLNGPQVSFLPAGLDVESVPQGWTDIVVKLVPDISVTGGPGVSAADVAASSFRLVMLAEVKKQEKSGGDYTLERIGVGNSLPIEGKDTVVTMGSRERQGVALNKAAKFALYAIEDNMHQSTILGGTSTFAVVGTRTHLKVGGSYNKVQLRYGVAVDPKTGAISRALWPVVGTKAGPSFVELSGDPTIHVPTSVVLDRDGGLVPKGVVFGMTELPRGRTVPLPAALAPLAAIDRYSSEQAAQLEKVFRSTVSAPSAVAVTR